MRIKMRKAPDATVRPVIAREKNTLTCIGSSGYISISEMEVFI